jgi:hypothetical protein
MRGSEQLILLAERVDYATSLDLKSAFNHRIVSEAFQPLLCFAFQGTLYAYRAMPLGAKYAPRLFTKAFFHLMAFIRRHRKITILHERFHHFPPRPAVPCGRHSANSYLLAEFELDYQPQEVSAYSFVDSRLPRLEMGLRLSINQDEQE